MSDEPKQRFHQFHLALLAYGRTAKDKLTAINAHSTIAAGIRFEQRLGSEKKALEFLLDKVEATTEDQLFQPLFRAWALGRSLVGFYFTNPDYCINEYERAEKFLRGAGPSPQVRVSTDIIREADEGGFDFRELCVLAAVYAVIGDKAYSIVHRDRVRAGALGYSSASKLFNKDGNITQSGNSILRDRLDRQRPLTVDQVRYTLSCLHERKFFSRLQPKRCGRVVYYSRSLSHDELAQKLLNRLERRSCVKTAHQSAESKFREKAASLLKRGMSGDEKKPILSPEIPQTIPAGVPGGVPAQVPAGVPALIPAYLCMPFNAFSSYECSPNGGANAPCAVGNETPKDEPEFKPPTAESVADFFKSLRKNPELPAELASAWFTEHGADPEWLKRDWRSPSARWALGRKSEEYRATSSRRHPHVDNF